MKINQQHIEQAKKKAKGDEQRRHAKSKVKKLQKTVTDVSLSLTTFFILLIKVLYIG